MPNVTFSELVADQFHYGGVKYANTKEKESTDILVDDYGFNWLLGTLNKYIYRYKNLGREKDLLKVACYCFIMWLKFGFHLEKYGTANDNYTTVETKAKHYSQFSGDVDADKFTATAVFHMDKENLLVTATNDLKDLRLRSNITRDRLVRLYKIMEALWIQAGFDKLEVHDNDTWNEKK